MSSQSALRVAVIGAGASGLAALRHLALRPNVRPTAFETSDRVGGTWIHNDKYKPTSMYDSLRTNLPKEIMAYPDFLYDERLPSFISHSDVQDYFEKYAQHFDLLPLIKFRTSVIEVTPLKEGVRSSECEWKVSSHNELSGETTVEIFNSVIVCNGHYSVPNYPEMPALDNFKGTKVHSHTYRNNQSYEGKSVVVIGRGPSGTDIGIDISQVAHKVYLSHHRDPLNEPIGTNIVEVPRIISSTASALTFQNGLTAHADVILYCTGYLDSFPFLSDTCCPLVSGGRVHGMYKHAVSIEHPTLYFLGLPNKILPCPLMDTQAAFVSALLIGAVAIPTRDEMEAAEQEECDIREAMGWPPRHAHNMNSLQWSYIKDLWGIMGKESRVTPVCETLYEYVHGARLMRLLTYRNQNFGLKSATEFQILEETGSKETL